MMKTFAIILIVFLVGSLIAARLEHRRLSHYWNRSCLGRQWKRRFPFASKADIRRFLDIFIQAFAFKQTYRLKFSPDDPVMEVYHALYPPKWTVADSLELETFVIDIRSTYGVDVVPHWREDITFGELFQLIQGNKA